MPNLQLSFAGRRRHRRLDPLGPGRVARHGRGPRRRVGRGEGGPSTSWSSSTSARAALQARRRQGRGRLAERGRRIRHQEARRVDEKLMFLGERTISPARLLRLPHIPGSRTPSRSARRSTAGASKSPAKLDYGHIAEYLEDQPADEDGTATAPPVLPGEAGPRDADGLPLPEAAPAAELRLPEEERGIQGLGRPAPDAAVRLGQRPGGDRGGHDLRARPDRREDRRPLPAQVALHAAQTPWRRGARSSTGTTAPAATSSRCPSSRSPRARRWTRRSPTSRPTSGSPTTAGPPTTSRVLPRPDLRPKKKLDAESIERELGVTADDGSRSRSRGCRPGSSRTS